MIKNLRLIFSGEKCLDSAILNVFGIQAMRYILSKSIYNLKFYLKNKSKFKKIYDDGCDKIENFLDKKEFEKIKEEFFKAINDKKFTKKITQTNENKESVNINSLEINEEIKFIYPNLYHLKNNSEVKEFFFDNEQKTDIKIYISLEQIEVIDNLNIDTQKQYHYDTFYNTFKAWLLIEDVNMEKGPFYYIPKSHKTSFSRLMKEWTYSVLFCFKKIDASPRFGNKKKERIKLDNLATKFTGKENTFIMANTHGLHRRGDAKINQIRNAIHFYSRENPFKI